MDAIAPRSEDWGRCFFTGLPDEWALLPDKGAFRRPEIT